MCDGSLGAGSEQGALCLGVLKAVAKEVGVVLELAGSLGGEVLINEGSFANGESQEANAVNELRVGIAVCAEVLECRV